MKCKAIKKDGEMVCGRCNWSWNIAGTESEDCLGTTEKELGAMLVTGQQIQERPGVKSLIGSMHWRDIMSPLQYDLESTEYRLKPKTELELAQEEIAKLKSLVKIHEEAIKMLSEDL